MNETDTDENRAIADRVLEFAEELEASGDATLGGSALEAARSALHDWIDRMTGVVVAPALGRVTIIHAGAQSTISSPGLPFEMTSPIGDSGRGGEG